MGTAMGPQVSTTVVAQCLRLPRDPITPLASHVQVNAASEARVRGVMGDPSSQASQDGTSFAHECF